MLTPTGSLHVPLSKYRAEAPPWRFHRALLWLTWLGHVTAWWWREEVFTIRGKDLVAVGFGLGLLLAAFFGFVTVVTG